MKIKLYYVPLNKALCETEIIVDCFTIEKSIDEKYREVWKIDLDGFEYLLPVRFLESDSDLYIFDWSYTIENNTLSFFCKGSVYYDLKFKSEEKKLLDIEA